MRVALLGASHWHVPLYLDALERSGVRVVAVSDREAVHGAAIAQRFGCPCLRTDEELLQRYDLDFAFAFGRHVDLPRTGEMLVARRIPFAIEKPCGVNADDVARLRAQAEAAGLYVAVPFIQRMGDLLRRIRETEAALPTRLHHASFRFIGGPLSRYRNGSAWMLDLSQSGGGCTINLGVHFIDLFRLLTGQEIIGVRALMSNRSQGAEVEDYSALLLTAADATVGLVETGYTFPAGGADKREFTFGIATDTGYYRSAPDGVVVTRRDPAAGEQQVLAACLDADPLYGRFVEQVLTEVRTGAAPTAGLREAEAVMRVIDAAYVSARANGALQNVV